MNIEFERNSVPLLEKFKEDRDIDGVVFDLDDTLFITQKYYQDAIYSLGFEITKYLGTSTDMVEEFKRSVYSVFERERYQPKLIWDQCRDGLVDLFGENTALEVDHLVDEQLRDFYEKPPEVKPGVEKVLLSVKELGLKLGVHSHAQEDWTRKKVSLLEVMTNLQIPYLATDIDLRKDAKSWTKASNMLGVNTEKLLVVGDSFGSDILPSIEAGSKNFIWIDLYHKGFPRGFVPSSNLQIETINKFEEFLA